MKNTITYYYRVSINGHSWLSPDGYSKYSERLKLFHEEKLKQDEVYGLEQAKEHVQEYYNKNDEYTEGRKKDVLTIEIVTTIVQIVDSFTYPV